MRSLIVIVFVAAVPLSLILNTSSYAQAIILSPMPDWVKLSDIRTLQSQYDDGIVKPYDDDDYVVEKFTSYVGDKTVTVNHFITRLSEFEIEEGVYNFRVRSETGDEKPIFHKIYLYRNEEVIDMRNKGSRSRDNWMDIEIPEAREGDLLEVAFSYTSKDERQKNEISDGFWGEDYFASGTRLISHTILIPEDEHLRFDGMLDERKYERHTENGIARYHLDFPDVEDKGESWVLYSFSSVDDIRYNSMPSWQTLISGAKLISSDDETMRNAFKAAATSITRELIDYMDRIVALTQFTAVDVEQGYGGLFPHNQAISDETLSHVLVNLLQAQGYDAQRVRVGAEGALMVYVKTSHGDLWIDPTKEAYEQMSNWLNPTINDETLIKWIDGVAPALSRRNNFSSEITSKLELRFPEGLNGAGTFDLSQVARGYQTSNPDDGGSDAFRARWTLEPVMRYFTYNFRANDDETVKYSGARKIENGQSGFSTNYEVPAMEDRPWVHGYRITPVFLGDINRMIKHHVEDHITILENYRTYPVKVSEKIVVNAGDEKIESYEKEIKGKYHRYHVRRYEEDYKMVIEHTYEGYKKDPPPRDMKAFTAEIDQIQWELYKPLYEYNRENKIYLTSSMGGLYTSLPWRSPNSRWARKRIEEQRARVEKGEISWLEAYEVMSSWEDLPPDLELKIERHKANELASQGRHQEAVEAFRLIKEKAYKVPAMFDLQLATIYLTLDQVEKAKDAFTEAMKTIDNNKRNSRKEEFNDYLQYLKGVYIRDDITQNDVDDVIEAMAAFGDLELDTLISGLELLIGMYWKLDDYENVAKHLRTVMYRSYRDPEQEWSNLVRLYQLSGNKKMEEQMMTNLKGAGFKLLPLVDKEGKHRPIYLANPVLPDNIQAEGSISVEIDVLENGRALSCSVIESTYEDLFDEDACDAAIQTRFFPYQKDGERVPIGKFKMRFDYNTFE